MAAAENKNRFLALGFTLGFHGLLFLLFILIVFITPIPPFPAPPDEVIQADILDIGGMSGTGQNAGGSGKNDNDLTTTTEDAGVKTPTESATPVSNVSPPNVVTDETSTDASVNKSTTPKSTTSEDAKTAAEEQASKELLAALDKLKSKRQHTGEGEGTGNTGGSGNGTSTGVGNGNTPEEGTHGHGPGGSGGWSLKGRTLLTKPERLTDATEEGIVVVDITVDETGKVIAAKAGARGSTTFSQKLYSKAQLAAKQLKFNASPNGATEQHGTYTVIFTLE